MSPARRLLMLAALAVPVVGCMTGGPGPDEPPAVDGTPLGPPPADAGALLDLVAAQVYADPDRTVLRYRTPGTPSHDETVPVLAEMLEARDLQVSFERFPADLGSLGRVQLTNVYGVRPGSGVGEVWLAAHWDSRAWADEDPLPENRDSPCLGANDGAAAVAVVVHALDLLPPTNATIRVALFDGEDQGDAQGGWAVGSGHAVQALSPDAREGITAVLLVDMPGDAGLEVRREGTSDARARPLVDLIFATAAKLGAASFIDEPGPAILDDHTAFLNAGVMAADIIHLDTDARRGPFPWTHHTVHDTPENLAGDRMAEVTDVVVATVIAIDAGGLAT